MEARTPSSSRTLSADGTKAFTRTPEFHPHGIVDKSLVIEEITIWKREIFTVLDQWNIGRVEASPFPPKNVSESIAFRENGIWAGTALSLRFVCRSADLRASYTPPLRQKVQLKHMAKVEWPDIFLTGKKYREACTATRSTLPLWRRKLLANPSLMDGPDTYEGDCVLNREKQAAAMNKKKRGSSSEPDSAPSGKAKGKGPADPEPSLGDLRSQSPGASGPLDPNLSPTQAGDTSYRSASPKSPRSQSSRRPIVLSLTVGPAVPPSAAELWADSDVAVAEFSIDEDLPAQWNMTPSQPQAESFPASRASSESGWEIPLASTETSAPTLPKPQTAPGTSSQGGLAGTSKRSRPPSAVESSKASRVSSMMDSISAFRKKPPPP